MKVTWTRRAREELDAIERYIARDAPKRATEFVVKLAREGERLSLHPYIGAVLREERAYRALVVDGYQLVYQVAAEGVIVARVIGPGMERARS